LLDNSNAFATRLVILKTCRVVFAEIPKTSTGKTQKFKLREMTKGV
jgi:hypothetical protein